MDLIYSKNASMSKDHMITTLKECLIKLSDAEITKLEERYLSQDKKDMLVKLILSDMEVKNHPNYLSIAVRPNRHRTTWPLYIYQGLLYAVSVTSSGNYAGLVQDDRYRGRGKWYMYKNIPMYRSILRFGTLVPY
jgi:hypothetical protein